MDAHSPGAGQQGARPEGSLALLEPAPVPAARGRRKAGARPTPERDDAYRHLSLAELRGYRTSLADEEGKVSYWRRILQARLDVLRAALEGGTAKELDTRSLLPVLSDARVDAGRRALVTVLPIDDIPPLPSLEELWTREVDPTDASGVRSLESDLAAAERSLSDYRSALHRRIGEATTELIARYREEPSLCLTALPVAPAQRAASA